jgi:hypothetical protein
MALSLSDGTYKADSGSVADSPGLSAAVSFWLCSPVFATSPGGRSRRVSGSPGAIVLELITLVCFSVRSREVMV